MEKPIQLQAKELKDGLVQIINDYHLPMIIVRPIIQELLTVAKEAEQTEYNKALAEYEKEGEHDTEC